MIRVGPLRLFLSLEGGHNGHAADTKDGILGEHVGCREEFRERRIPEADAILVNGFLGHVSDRKSVV